MLAADVVKDYTQTVMLPGTTPIKELAARLEPLARRGKEEIRAEGIAESAIHLEPFLDIRYRGQSYELIVPFSDHIIIDFHSLHEHQYGYAKSAGDIEIVNLRLRAVGKVTPPPFLDRPKGSADAQVALIGAWPVVFEQGNLETLLYDANRLQPGNRMNGPAVIVRQDTTILVGPKDIVNVDPFDNLVIEVAQ
jgi:N-methylhydantoinase A